MSDWDSFSTLLDAPTKSPWDEFSTPVEQPSGKWYDAPPTEWTPEDAQRAYQAVDANPLLPGQHSLGEQILGAPKGIIQGLAAAPANIKNRLGAVTAEAIAQLTEFTHPELSQQYRDVARREMGDIALRDARLSEGAPETENLFRNVGNVIGESLGLGGVGGLGALASYYGTSSYAEAKAQGKSERESVIHGLIEGAATYAGGKLGAGVGRLAGAVGFRTTSQDVAAKSLGAIFEKIGKAATIETTEEVATELAHYLNEVAHGKQFNKRDLIDRLSSVAGPALLSGGIGEGIASAVEARRQALPKIEKGVAAAEKFVAEKPERIQDILTATSEVVAPPDATSQEVVTPPTMSRRQYAEATGNSTSSIDERQAFIAELQRIDEANRKMQEATALSEPEGSLPQPEAPFALEQQPAIQPPAATFESTAIQQPDLIPDLWRGSLEGQQGLFDQLPVDKQTANYSNPFPAVQINLGDIGKTVGKSVESTRRWLKKYFTSTGLRNEDIQRLRNERAGAIGKEAKALEQLQADLDRAVYGQYGRKRSVPPEVRTKMDAALKGEQTDLPAPILQALAPMREQIDALSRDIIAAGIGSEELQATIDENLGVYLTRTYRKYSERNWAAAVKENPEVMQAAREALRQEFPDDSPSDIEWRINMLLDRDSVDARAIPKKFHKDAKFQSILMQRQDLPKWLRDLYGEYRDPWINHTISVTKMAELLAHHDFVTNLRQLGLEHGFFSETDTKNPEHYRQVNATNNRLLAPLADLYTDPETASALEDMFSAQHMSKLYRWATGASMLAKWNAVIGNSKTYVRNFLGNPGFAISNGDLFSGDITKSVQATANNLLAMPDAEMRAYVRRLAELNLLDSEVSASELKAMMGDFAEAGEIPKLTGNAVARGVKRGVGVLNRTYQAMDTFWKVNGFESKKKYYAELHPDATLAQIEQLAADDVRAHYPTYSEVPKGVKAIGRFPLLGNFLSFRSEVLRTLKNVVKTGLREVRSSNPVERRMGRKRLIGTAISLGTLPAIGYASRLMFGVSKEDDEDVRLFQAPWTRNSAYLYSSPIQNGEVESLDLSFMDPRAQFSKPIFALLGPGTTDDKIEQVFTEALDPLGEDLLFGRVFGAFYNKTPDGRQVYNEAAGSVEKARRSAEYIGEALLPGTWNQVRRIQKGLAGEISAGGRPYDPVVELAATLGIRATPVDVRQGLFYRGNDLRRSVRDAEAGIRSALTRRGTVSNNETERIITDFMRQREKYVRQWSELAHAAIRLGVPADEVGKSVYEAAGSRALAEQIMAGTYSPYVPSDETLENAFASPGGGERVGIFRRLTPAPQPSGN